MVNDKQLRSASPSSSSAHTESNDQSCVSSPKPLSPLRSSSKLVRSITKSSAKNIKRAISFDMTNKSVKKNDILIDASKTVPSEELWDNLRLLKAKKNNITDVKVQGLVMNTTHQDKIPMVQELAFAGRFDTFLFLETIDIKSYPIWKERKHGMMEERFKAKKSLRSMIVWQAQVSVAKGTSLESLEDFLSSLQGDLSCGDVSFVTASHGKCESPEDIGRLIDRRQLREELSVVVSCGCGENDHGLRLLENSTKMMSRMLAQKGKRRRNTKTAAAATGEGKQSSGDKTITDGSESSATTATSSSKESFEGSAVGLNRATSWDDFCAQNRERLYMKRAQRMEALVSRQNQKLPMAA